MKQYLGYSETSYFTYWPLYRKDPLRIPKGVSGSSSGRFSCRYVGFCTRKDIIEIIGRDIVHSMNWVKERIMETDNEHDIKLCDDNTGCIVVYNDTVSDKKEIIEIINIKERRAKIEAEKRKNSNV